MAIELDPGRDGLIIVDVQPDFMPGGGLPIPRGDDVVTPIGAFLERFLLPTVVATQDWHPPGHISFASVHPGLAPFDTIELHDHEQVLWPDHCVQGTSGAALHTGLPTIPITSILRKGMNPNIDSYSGFRDNHGPGGRRPETGLAGFLRDRGVRRVFVCGLALDVCVAWTAEDAVVMGFEVVLLRDMSRSVTAEGEISAIEKMRKLGVVITTSGELSSPTTT